jgi:DNA-binding transcriptional LysR family regulator
MIDDITMGNDPGSERNLSAVDLNLLLVLHTVLTEGSATGAARQLHVTQSAVSNSLSRLRDLFGDRLVVRNGRGLAPTPLARELAPRLAAAVKELEHVVGGGRAFDPAATTRRFTFACSDGIQLHDVPALFAVFSRRLPRASLRVVSVDYLIAGDGLATGDVDVALGPRESAGEGIRFQPLYSQAGVLVARRGNRQVGTAVTPAEFNRLRFVDTHITLGRPGIGHRVATDTFARHGLVRNIVLTVSHFATAAMVVARSNCVAALPERLAEVFCGAFPLRTLRMPLMDRLRFETGMMWHQRADQDPGSRFFREVVAQSLTAESRTGKPRRAGGPPGPRAGAWRSSRP